MRLFNTRRRIFLNFGCAPHHRQLISSLIVGEFALLQLFIVIIFLIVLLVALLLVTLLFLVIFFDVAFFIAFTLRFLLHIEIVENGNDSVGAELHHTVGEEH
eukprot:TRINITY_DN8587_c0_g1_i3.p1 TRINITY_DN8587_c0_g1~~TRINITY_DN8587_c0_g1_i3.p1  ORF type:complete len:102 (-),score=25.03 TRINITY_DN8587_c0_g1_i3:67-372(-)